MNEPVITKIKCAIYSRKSVETGLDVEFSSIDAQKEACEMYIGSQRSKGWIKLGDHYDDGGFTGGNMERPALQRMLQDIEDKKIDIVVVYKHDRLTRSLADFAKLIELFEKHNVSFVSVTQDFNTSTSAGRLFLNMLFSFAQYEREIIAERTRDKMTASRKKGMWMGGTVPFGYDAVDKKLVINKEEAEILHFIYDRFIETESVVQVVKEVREKGYITKSRSTRSGKSIGGKSLDKGTIYRILETPIYTGKVVSHGNIYDGRHEAIITNEKWEQIRAIMNEDPRRKIATKRTPTPAYLRGVISCGGCMSGMLPTHTLKKGKQYRYYVPDAHVKKQCQNCKVGHISAGIVEEKVFEEVKLLLRSPEIVAKVTEIVQQNNPKYSEELVRKSLVHVSALWDELFPVEQNRIIKLLIKDVIVTEKLLTVHLYAQGMGSLVQELHNINITDKTTKELNEYIQKDISYNAQEKIFIVNIPSSFTRRSGRKFVIIPENHTAEDKTENKIISALGKARLWKNQIEQGKVFSLEEIAIREGVNKSHISRILNLNLLAPDIIEKIIHDTAGNLNLSDLTKAGPMEWEEQRKMLGLNTVSQ